MKCIKKLVALTLAAVLALTMLTACGGTSDTKSVADKVADIINAERVAANHTELPRATEVDKLWSRWQNCWQRMRQIRRKKMLRHYRQKAMQRMPNISI